MNASPAAPRPLAIALAGLLALAVAMGIGRFAFTPLLPIMVDEGALDVTGASLLASANYLGYLVGALVCTFQPWLWRRLRFHAAVDGPAMVRLGLVATSLLTAGMAWPWPAAWSWLRFAAGVASAIVFLHTTAWCLEQLARRQVPSMGALIYAGPGLGIVANGLVAGALVAWRVPAATGWLAFSLLAAALTAAVWRVFDARHAITPAQPNRDDPVLPSTAAAAPAGPLQSALLALAYGLAGLGYIISATFLPVIARQVLPGSPWLDLFWPLVGVGVIVGALTASRIATGSDLRLRLVASYAIQAAGVAAGLVSPTLAGFALGSLLLGLPLTAISFFAMQEARRLQPLQATSLMGLLTATYGVGQVGGPPLAALLVARSATPAAGFAWSLWIASGALVLGALLYLVLARCYPARA